MHGTGRVKVYPKVDLIKRFGISFHLKNLPSYNLLIQELKSWNLRIYVNIAETTFFERVSQSFTFDFRSQVVPNEGFLYFLYFFN